MNYSSQMEKFLSKITVIVCITTFQVYGSSSESDYDSNRSGSALSVCFVMENYSNLIVASLYESRIKTNFQF